MKTYSVANECPCCGHKMDSISGFNTDETPRPGDVTVCIRCGAICTFNQDMSMKLALDTSGPDWEEARKVQKKVREINGLPA